MTFRPVLPFGGFAGWAYLQRTLPAQQDAYAASPSKSREITKFHEKISEVTTAAELVNDRDLLRVALGAYGLDDDLGNKFFIQKVLEEGTIETSSLANKLSDPRYRALSAAFGFGPGEVPGFLQSGFAENITTSFLTRSFEVDIGEQNSDIRLALNLQRELSALAESTQTENTKWFSVMGQPPLRQVFETAFGLPSSFAALDIDQQLNTLKDRAASYFGSSDLSQFQSATKIDDLTRTFLARADKGAGSTGIKSGAATALALLGG